MSEVEIERKGPFCWSWCARGRLRKARQYGSYIVMPGNSMEIESGIAFTRRGARRRAGRVLKRWT